MLLLHPVGQPDAAPPRPYYHNPEKGLFLSGLGKESNGRGEVGVVWSDARATRNFT